MKVNIKVEAVNKCKVLMVRLMMTMISREV